MLLDAGADVDGSTGGLGLTPLFGAVMNEHDAAIAMLLSAGANPNALGRGGLPLLNLVKTEATAELLIGAGADVNATFRGGHTLYEMAGITKCAQIQETLRKAGAL